MSDAEQQIEIGRVVTQHKKRLEEMVALEARIKRIGGVFREAASGLLTCSSPGSMPMLSNSRNQLERISSELDLSAVVHLIDEHAELAGKLKEDQEFLKVYGLS